MLGYARSSVSRLPCVHVTSRAFPITRGAHRADAQVRANRSMTPPRSTRTRPGCRPPRTSNPSISATIWWRRRWWSSAPARCRPGPLRTFPPTIQPHSRRTSRARSSRTARSSAGVEPATQNALVASARLRLLPCPLAGSSYGGQLGRTFAPVLEFKINGNSPPFEDIPLAEPSTSEVCDAFECPSTTLTAEEGRECQTIGCWERYVCVASGCSPRSVPYKMLPDESVPFVDLGAGDLTATSLSCSPGISAHMLRKYWAPLADGSAASPAPATTSFPADYFQEGELRVECPEGYIMDEGGNKIWNCFGQGHSSGLGGPGKVGWVQHDPEAGHCCATLSDGTLKCWGEFFCRARHLVPIARVWSRKR